MMEITSNTYYDKVSSLYREISKTRCNYLQAVDAIVTATVKRNKIKSWLDIGVGDGERISGLLGKVKAEDVVCLEPSAYMFQQASQSLEGKCIVIRKSLATYSKDTDRRFSFVTALWNVIGHSVDPVSFLRDAYALLDNNGLLLIDANNRYNVRQYGFLPVMRNAILDYLGLSTKGVFKLKTNNEGVFTYVYIASPRELRKACKVLNIEEININFVDYMTGEPAGYLTGQMVVRITKGGIYQQSCPPVMPCEATS